MDKNHFKEECVHTEWSDDLEGKLGFCADTVQDIRVYIVSGDKPTPIHKSKLSEMDLPFSDEFDDWKLAYYDPDATYEEEANGGN